MTQKDESNGGRQILVVAGQSAVRGFDRDTGDPVWSFEIRGTPGLFVGPARVPGAIELAIHGDRVIAATTERLVWLDYATGALITDVRLGARGHRPSFVIDGDRIYLATGVDLACYGLDGKLEWRRKLGEWDAVHAFALGFPGNLRQGDYS